MRTSSPSRNMRARKPSHFGSKIQLESEGSWSTRLASIGEIGGCTTSCIMMFSAKPQDRVAVGDHPRASRYPSWPGCAVQISQPDHRTITEILGISGMFRDLKNDIQEYLSQLAG